MANLGNIALVAELDGVLLMDKPVGLSAHDAMKALKTHFNLVKIGHGGTLDATAEGLFVLLLGNATRLSEGLMSADRAYDVTLTLGRATDTGDRAGNVLSEREASAVTPEALEAALKELRGDIYQKPPAASAVRLPGAEGYRVVPVPAEEAARERIVHVYRAAVTSFAPPALSLQLKAAKGFSVRAFARDLGELLGCGASVASCRCLSCGGYDVKDALPFMKLMTLHAVDFAARVTR